MTRICNMINYLTCLKMELIEKTLLTEHKIDTCIKAGRDPKKEFYSNSSKYVILTNCIDFLITYICNLEVKDIDIDKEINTINKRLNDMEREFNINFDKLLSKKQCTNKYKNIFKKDIKAFKKERLKRNEKE